MTAVKQLRVAVLSCSIKHITILNAWFTIPTQSLFPTLLITAPSGPSKSQHIRSRFCEQGKLTQTQPKLTTRLRTLKGPTPDKQQSARVRPSTLSFGAALQQKADYFIYIPLASMLASFHRKEEDELSQTTQSLPPAITQNPRGPSVPVFPLT